MTVMRYGDPFFPETSDNGLTVPFRRFARGRIADMADSGHPKIQSCRKDRLKNGTELPDLEKRTAAHGRYDPPALLPPVRKILQSRHNLGRRTAASDKAEYTTHTFDLTSIKLPRLAGSIQ